MTNYQWTENTKPDRPGIWAVRNTDGSASIREIKNPESWGEYTWAFLMDLPDIKDPPRYRDVCQGDVGRMVQASDNTTFDLERGNLCTFTEGKLIHIRRDGPRPFVIDEGETHQSCRAFRFCRILDDGQPKREPREITLYSRNGHIGVVQLDDDCEAILFREVVE